MHAPPDRAASAAPPRRLRRVLLYTHNSIGLGHLVRSLAVIDGMRRHRPDLDFLVLTGSSLPQLLLAEGVEVLRLPGLLQELEGDRPVLRPRLLTSLSTEELVGLRRRVIAGAVRDFAPDAVLVEHYPAGLHGEALPLLGLDAGAGGGRAYVLAHLGRGEPRPPAWLQAAAPGLDETLAAYDLLYVLDHPTPGPADAGAAAAPWRDRLTHLGPVAIRNRRELPPAREALARLGLEGRGLVLLSLGRGGPVAAMARALLEALPVAGLGDLGAALVLDPYLPPERAEELRGVCRRAGAVALGFLPRLVEIVAAAELVVCRAGYNTVTELLMTGARALVVPERHPSGEQEERCGRLRREHVLVAGEGELASGRAAELLRRAAALSRGSGEDCDRFAVGRRIVEDLEARLAAIARSAGA